MRRKVDAKRRITHFEQVPVKEVKALMARAADRGDTLRPRAPKIRRTKRETAVTAQAAEPRAKVLVIRKRRKSRT